MIINVNAIVITSTMVRVHENAWQIIFSIWTSYILLDLVSIKVNSPIEQVMYNYDIMW